MGAWLVEYDGVRVTFEEEQRGSMGYFAVWVSGAVDVNGFHGVM